MYRDEEWYMIMSNSEKLEAYEAGERYLDRMLSYDISAHLRENINFMRIRDFIDVKLDLDYVPFTGKVKWHPTGLIDMHGKWKFDWDQNWYKIFRTNKKKRLSVDPSLYTFKMVKLSYDLGYMTVEEYLENTRRVAKYVREEN